jgi:hypothetical protein
LRNTDFDRQIAQADLISTETPLTGSTGLTNTRVRADELREEELDNLPFGATQFDIEGNALK